MTRAFAAAADWLLHPGVAVAAVLLVVNDAVLKARFGNWATGKLSDAAGLYLVPLGVLALVALFNRGLAHHARLQQAVMGGTALAFVIVKTTATGAATYGQLIGWLRAPIRMLADTHGSWLEWSRPIVVIVDPTDLLVLPILLVVAMQLGARGRAGAHDSQPLAEKQAIDPELSPQSHITSHR